MRTGCLFVFGRMVAQALYGLGAMIAGILITTVSFVMITVVGPFVLGLGREIVVRALRITHRGHPTESGLRMGTRSVYAALSGLVWVAGFFFLRAMSRLAGWVGAALAAQLPPSLQAWLPTAVVVCLIFVIGSVVGTMVHRLDHGAMSGW